MKKLIVSICSVLLLMGCAQGSSYDGIVVEQNQSAVTGDGGVDGGADAGEDTEIPEDPEFWYLRCNSTSWNVDDVSRMVDTDDPNIKTLTFDVNYIWMITGFDSCNLTRTEAKNQWFPGLEFHVTNPLLLEVPATGGLVPSYSNFNVKYPALGTYKATLDVDAGTVTISSLSQIPTCDDEILNGQETDLDCGGPVCGGCAEGKSCVIDTDCLSNSCVDDKCVIIPTDCDAATAIDLGSDGQSTTVPTNGCVKVEDNYPVWWGTSRTMNIMNSGSENFPVPFTWNNACTEDGDSEEFTFAWQSIYLSDTSAECPTVINLMGSGAEDITLLYYGL